MKQNWSNLSVYKYETITYLIFGILTVAVNLLLFFCLDIFFQVANTIAFLASAVFAYWTNTVFVFRQKMSLKTFSAFLAMRSGSLIIDNGGIYLLLEWEFNKLFAKCILNGIVIVLNYLFSKFFIIGKNIKG